MESKLSHTFFSIPYQDACIRSLRSHLVPATDVSSVKALDEGPRHGQEVQRAIDDFVNVQLDDDILDKDRQHVFFKPIPFNASRVVRLSTVSSSSLKGVLPIAIHKLVAVESDMKEVIVSSEALGLAQTEEGCNQPVLLRTSMLPQDYLMKASIWKAEPNMHYSLPSSRGVFRSKQERDLFSNTIAPRLLAPRGFISDVHNIELPDALSSLLPGLLARLRAERFVEQRGHPWHFTEHGHALLKVGLVLSGGLSALARTNLRRLPPLQLSTYELMTMLQKEGWSHTMLTSRREANAARKTFYDGGRPNCTGKVFYSVSGRTSISR